MARPTRRARATIWRLLETVFNKDILELVSMLFFYVDPQLAKYSCIHI